jgi:hypothetical protein
MCAGVDAPAEPRLLVQPWDGVACPCGSAMLDRSLTCTDAFQLLPLSSCADVSAATARWADVRAVTTRWRCVLDYTLSQVPVQLR